MIDLIKLAVVILLVTCRLVLGDSPQNSPIILDPTDPNEPLYAWRDASCAHEGDLLKITVGTNQEGAGELQITLENFIRRMVVDGERGQLVVTDLNQNLRWLEKYPIVFTDREGEIRALDPNRHKKSSCTFQVYDLKMVNNAEIDSFRLAVSCNFLVGLNEKSWGYRNIIITETNPIVCQF